jgi:uncharacterized membrane protein YeiH
MDYFAFLTAGLCALATAAITHFGLVIVNRGKTGSWRLDAVGLTAFATFVAILIAQNPEWLS